jgi:hypothetical protein
MRIIPDTFEGDMDIDILLSHKEIDAIKEHTAVFSQISCGEKFITIGIRKKTTEEEHEDEMKLQEAQQDWEEA